MKRILPVVIGLLVGAVFAFAQPALRPGGNASGIVSGTGTANILTKWLNASTVTNGTLTDTASQANQSVCFADGTPPYPVLNCGDSGIKYNKGTATINLVNGSFQVNGVNVGGLTQFTIPNASVTGTTTNKLVKLTGAPSTAVISATVDTVGAIGICTSGCGTTGSATVTMIGGVSCVFDGATTASDYVQISSSVAGDCHDAGATYPGTGEVLGKVLSTNGSGGTYTMEIGSLDTSSTNSGGTLTGSGAANRVTVWNGANSLSGTANNQYDLTNFRQAYASATTAADNSANMFKLSGTMPTTPSATVQGILASITGAGSSSQINEAFHLDYLAGYTGSSATRGFSTTNAAVGTGSTPNLASTTAPVGNIGVFSLASAAGAGDTFGVIGDATGSTGLAAGVYGRSAGAVAGTNIGGLFSAAGSTEGTGPKNVAVLGTLASTDPATYAGINGSFAGMFDGGTLPDSNSSVLYAKGTLPAAPSAAAIGIQIAVTSAGSAAQEQYAVADQLLSGYTGNQNTYGTLISNTAAGTASTLNLNSAGTFLPQGNQGLHIYSNSTGAGANYGTVSRAQNSTTYDIAYYGWAGASDSGTHIGVLGTATNSSQATNLKNAAGIFTLHTALPTGSNTSVALIADGAGSDEYRGYNAGTLNFKVDSAGIISSGGNAGLTTTKTVRASGGAADCTLIYTGGLLTGGSC